MKTLRASFGCRYDGKVPAQVRQKFMRHSNIRVTMDDCANVDDAALEAVLGPQRNSSRNTQPPQGGGQFDQCCRKCWGEWYFGLSRLSLTCSGTVSARSFHRSS